MRSHLSVLAIGIFLMLVGCRGVTQNPGSGRAEAGKPAVQQVVGDYYYFDRCPECDGTLGAAGDPVVRVYDGRHLRFDQASCAAAFEKDLASSFRKLDAKMIEDQRPHYPLETCVVTGKPLGSATVEIVRYNRMVRLVDETARREFDRDPTHYLAILDDAAIRKHAPGYVVKKCPMQGTALEPEVDKETTVVCANRIIRVCCTDCAAFVHAHPSHYLPLIDSAQRMLAPGH